MTRKIDVLSGPNQALEITKFQKKDRILHLEQVAQIRKQRYNINYYIDCPSNTFTLSISEPSPSDKSVDGASSSNFSFYLNGICDSCDFTFVEGSVIELDLFRKTIANIGVVFEEFYLFDKKNKFRVSLEYENNSTSIVKLDNDGEAIKEDNPFVIPLVDWDFSNTKKIINKIKTLLVFS